MEDKPDLIRSIAHRLFRIVKKQSRLKEKPVPLSGNISVTPTESHAIQATGEGHAINVTELSRILGISKSAASQTAGKLAKKGFLDKTRPINNNKEVHLQLTALGQKVFEAHQLHHEQHLATIKNRLNSFSISQIATAMVILEIIEDIIDEKLSS